MKNKADEKYFKLGLTGIVVVLVAMALVFLLMQSSAIGGFLSKVMKVLMPFVYGFVVAYILAPFCNRIERFIENHIPAIAKAKKGIAILIAMLVALLVVFALVMLVVPSLIQSIMQIVQALPTQMSNFSAWFSEFLESYPQIQAYWEEFSSGIVEKITSWLQTDLLSWLQTAAASLSTQVTGIFTFFKNVFFGVLISVYLLASRKKFSVQFRLLLCSIFPKRWADAIEREVLYADKMFNGFLMGRLIDSAIIGVICFVFTFLCGFDSCVLVSVVIGVTNVIPVFGPYLGAIPCALLLLLENPLHCLIFLIFIIILQLIDGNVLGPHILGGTTGISSFWVLFSVLFFGGLWGIVGMIVGVPLFAVIYDILKQLIYKGLKHWGRDDLIARFSKNPPASLDGDGEDAGDGGDGDGGEETVTAIERTPEQLEVLEHLANPDSTASFQPVSGGHQDNPPKHRRATDAE